jgi:putative glycosyltransferase (TIGR04372 family)
VPGATEALAQQLLDLFNALSYRHTPSGATQFLHLIGQVADLRSRDLFLHVGHALLDHGEVAAAMAAYSESVEASADARFDAGQRLLDHVNRDSTGLRDLSEILAGLANCEDFVVPDLERAILLRLLDMPQTTETRHLAQLAGRRASGPTLLELGSAFLAEGKHRPALGLYHLGIQKNPQDLPTRLQIGITHFLAGEYAAAEQHFALAESLARSERDRWNVADLPVRVLDKSWLLAVGHIAALDTYVKAMELGWLPKLRSVLAFSLRDPPAGWRLLTYWGRYLEIIGAVGDPGDAVDRHIFGAQPNDLNSHDRDLRRAALSRSFWAGPDGQGRTRWYAPWGAAVQRAWRDQERGPLLDLTSEEEPFRVTMEQAFGLPRDAWFVLLHVREPGFHGNWHKKHAGTRNADVATYSAAIQYVLDAGGWVVRAGDPSMTPLAPRERVIDYATSPLRSHELDVLLCATCRFFVGTNSGFSLIPPLFGKRCALTNWSPLAIPNWFPDDVYIPKLVRNRVTGDLLTLEEMFSSPAGWSQFARDFEQEVEILENSSDDILAAVRELHEDLCGTLSLTPADKARIRRFNGLAADHGSYPGSRIGAKFLETHQELL